MLTNAVECFGMLNGGSEDPASTFLPQPEAWLMSCALTDIAILPLKSALMDSAVLHSRAALSSHHLSQCGNL